MCWMHNGLSIDSTADTMSANAIVNAVGPDRVTSRQVLDRVAQGLGIGRWYVPLPTPFFVWQSLAYVCEACTIPLVSTAQVLLMQDKLALTHNPQLREHRVAISDGDTGCCHITSRSHTGSAVHQQQQYAAASSKFLCFPILPARYFLPDVRSGVDDIFHAVAATVNTGTQRRWGAANPEKR